MTSKFNTSPLQRLTESRQAIVRHMNHNAQDAATDASQRQAGDPEIDASLGTWGLIKQVASSWWHGHPAHAAIDFVKPMVQTYAEEKPMKLLGISAGLGIAVVVLRPWRLISLTGLLLAAVKSTEMSGVVRSLLARGHGQDRVR